MRGEGEVEWSFMASLGQVVLPGYPHHVTQRGVDGVAESAYLNEWTGKWAGIWREYLRCEPREERGPWLGLSRRRVALNTMLCFDSSAFFMCSVYSARRGIVWAKRGCMVAPPPRRR